MNNSIIFNWLNTVSKNTSNLVNSSLEKLSTLDPIQRIGVSTKKVNTSNSSSSKTFTSLSGKDKNFKQPSDTLEGYQGALSPSRLGGGANSVGTRDRDKKQPILKSSSLQSGQNPGRIIASQSITYEEIGLFPRSFVRVFDRFLKQLFSDVESLVIEEYRFYRYIILTSFKTMLTLLLVPLLINICSKNYIIRPLTEYFWNNKNTEIFLNVSQQKKAFSELQEFEEELYFESLISLSHITRPQEQLLSPVHASSYNSAVPVGGVHATPSPGTKKPTSLAFFVQEIGTGKGSPEGVGNREKMAQQKQMEISEDVLGTVQPLHSPNQTLGNSSSQGEVSLRGIASPIVPLPHGLGYQGQGSEARSYLSFQAQTKDFSMEHNSLPSYQGFGGDQDDKRMELLNGVFTENNHMTGLHSKFTEKAKELALHYNHQSIEAITNFLGDLLGLITLCYLILTMKIQINITKAFLTEFFFGLEDSKKSLIILLVTDLLVGYHSPHLWELFFEFLLDYYGFPQTETGIELLVATIPPVLDVLFKYLIFRHLNRTSPATVATYNAMIE